MEHTTYRTGTLLETAAREASPVHRSGFAAPAPAEDPPPGDRIRAARAAADLNREQLAERIGSSARTVRRLEDGKRRATAEELRSIAEACGAPEWFLAHGWRGHERDAPR